MVENFDIKAERKAKKLSQADVAAALGVNQSTVARWEDDWSSVKPFIVDAVRRFIEQAEAPATEAAE